MDGMWYYEYAVSVYNEDQLKDVICRGIVCAEDYGDAAHQIEKRYGSSLIKINNLICTTEGIYEFNGLDTEFKIHLEA